MSFIHPRETAPDLPDLYRRLVEQTRDYAVFVLDPQGNVRSWNVGAQRIKGYQPEEIIGRHFSNFYTRDAVERGWPAHELKVATAEGRFEDEGWRVRKDGSRFWANVVITALRDDEGHLLGFSKITRDLTERRKQEESLRQAEERFRLLVEGVQDYAIFMLDPDGVVTSWNAGAQRIKGYRREQILGKHFSKFYTPEDIAAGKPWEELAVARRTGRVETEGWRMKADGQRFWARAIVTPLFDTDGRLRGFAKVTQDLTDERHIQELETAANRINEFIGVLAHELRNPLAPIRSAALLLANAPAEGPMRENLRGIIERQSAHLSRIVDDLMDISRITRGSLPVERSRVDLRSVVRSAVETATPAIRAARHILEVDVPKEPLMVEGDAGRLNQLLANLLNNAARYTPPGGKIWVAAKAEGDNASIRVRDNGIGIAPALIDRIFDMFVQGREPLQRVGGGLGVGLALARKIAEFHGGTLEAQSAGANAGSEFVFRMPRLTRAGTATNGGEAEPAPESTKNRAPQRVLVVDDNIDAAMTLELMVRSLGHEPRVVHDGVAALEATSEFRPHTVLLDIGMPGLDGYEVARRLRAWHVSQPMRIVAVTGWGQESDRRESRDAGFDLHLVKPVDTDTLARALEDAEAQ